MVRSPSSTGPSPSGGLASDRLHRRPRFVEGSSFSFGAAHIHDVSQTGPVPATSIHAYSPRLGQMGFYEVGADGLLSRRAGGAAEEFC